MGSSSFSFTKTKPYPIKAARKVTNPTNTLIPTKVCHLATLIPSLLTRPPATIVIPPHSLSSPYLSHSCSFCMTLIMTYKAPEKYAVKTPPSTHSPGLVAFVATFVHDLDASPTANKDDADAIEKLVWSLKASNIRVWARKKFPKLTEKLKAPRLYPGRRLCAIHENMATTCLFNLHDLVMDEIKIPAKFFTHPRLGNHYLSAYDELNRIWDKEYQNTPNPKAVTQLRFPLANHQLFQENNCAGCCLRRVFSDPNIIAVLIIAVRFKEFEYYTREREILDYLEVGWQLLSEKLPHVIGTREDAVRARAEFEEDAKDLSNWSKTSAFRENLM